MIVQYPEIELEIRFQNFRAIATELNGLSENEQNLLYGLEKQIEEGDNYTPSPWIFNILERCKWEAWNKQQGKSNIMAKYDYIYIVLNLQLKYR